VLTSLPVATVLSFIRSAIIFRYAGATLFRARRPEGEWAQRLREGAQLLVAATGLRWLEIAGLQWQDVDWSGNRIYLRRTFIDGKIAERLTTKKSKSAGAMAPLLARFLRKWHGATVYAGPTDWVFASGKEKGRIPRVGNMLVSDHLRPAAIKS
jgi:integrase